MQNDRRILPPEHLAIHQPTTCLQSEFRRQQDSNHSQDTKNSHPIRLPCDNEGTFLGDELPENSVQGFVMKTYDQSNSGGPQNST